MHIMEEIVDKDCVVKMESDMKVWVTGVRNSSSG